jgi:hypothetical protein
MKMFLCSGYSFGVQEMPKKKTSSQEAQRTNFWPIAKAKMEDILRVKKYRPPGCTAHSSSSHNCSNPASSNCRFASAVK